MYLPIEFSTEEEIQTKNLLDAFPGLPVIERLIENREEGIAHIKKKAITMLVGSIVWLIVFITVSGVTFPYLMSTDPADEQLQVIPVLSIVFFGMGITMTAFSR